MPTPSSESGLLPKLLNHVERAGNRLPDPMTLFIVGTLLIMILSQVAANTGWTVRKQVSVTSVEGGTRTTGSGQHATKFAPDGSATITTTTTTHVKDGTRIVQTQTQEVKAVGLLTRDGFYWVLSNMVKNFTDFAPLGIVLVAMLGIGVAEKTGLIGAVMKIFAVNVPGALLTPAMLFIGIMSSMALDAGYVVLPPIAAALYKSVGRSPLAGLAAVFAGVSAGFSANLLITGLDPLLAGFTQEAAQLIDTSYVVAPTCNYWFMIVSTIALTLTGWAVTAWSVEPRYAARPPEEGGPSPVNEDDRRQWELTPQERRGLRAGVIAMLVTLGVGLLLLLPGGPLHDEGTELFPRWVMTIVPLLFIVFLIPGVAYGIAAGTIRSDKDVAKLMGATMADMGPYIVLAFFAGQFVALFKYSNLGEMVALTGGNLLAAADMPVWLLLVVFIVIVMLANLFMTSASAKYAFLAPVFVPMFMTGARISPELTQAAYRVGDSCTNIISPLNAYLIIILVFVQKYMPRAGLGTLVSLMLPYTVVFFIAWTALLVAWVLLGIDLGPGGPLEYVPK